MAAFSETTAPTSRWYVAEQAVIIQNLSETLQSSLLHSTSSALEKQAKDLTSDSFFISKKTLVAIFYETRAHTSIKNVAEQGIIMENLLQTLQTFWSYFSLFNSEKYPENAKFLDFLPLKELLVVTFSKVCALTSKKCVSNSDVSIPNFSDKLKFFLDTLLRFCFRRKALKSRFSDFLYLQGKLWWLVSVRRVHPFPHVM